MAYIGTAAVSRHLDYSQAPSAPRRGFFARAMSAIMEARMRQAEREVARYLAASGGKFTDDAEREIERRFLSTPSGL